MPSTSRGLGRARRSSPYIARPRPPASTRSSGTFQNLGYALQWPLFAGFCVYGYYKFVRYEDAPPEPKSHDTEIPAELLPERPKPTTQSDDDPALREYNAYLADLAEKDKEP